MSNNVQVIDKILYTATATATGGREGKVLSDDEKFSHALSVPKGLGGGGGDGTNPEQLFAAGYAACFGGALGLVARMQKVDVGAPKITAKVSIGKSGEKFALAVELTGHFGDNIPREQAQALMDAAHQVCPYSNATRGNIDVKVGVA